MSTNHIDQLKEWWENAKEGLPSTGDTLIWRKPDSSYEVFTAGVTDDALGNHIRILARAPEPKPAWCDAVAVIAHTARFSERRPFALTHTEDVLDPYNTEWTTRDDLIDPTPLIEAKVTDEAMQRVFNALDPAVNKRLSMTKEDEEYVRYIVAAALGLENR